MNHSSLCLLLLGGLVGNGGIRIQLLQQLAILQWVAVGLGENDRDGLGDECLGDFVGLQQASKVGVGHLRSRKMESFLDCGGLGVGAEDRVELAESTLGPDDQTSNMSTRGELQQVETIDGNSRDTRNVAEGLLDSTFGVVDNKRSLLLLMTAVTGLSFTGTDVLGVVDLLDVIPGSNSLEEGNGFLGLLESFDLVADDERDLVQFVDNVSTSLDKSGDSGSGDSRSSSVAALSNVDATMPAAPGLQRSEHMTTTAHVTEGTLAGTVGTTTTDTRNTGNSTSSTPRFSRSLVT